MKTTTATLAFSLLVSTSLACGDAEEASPPAAESQPAAAPSEGAEPAAAAPTPGEAEPDPEPEDEGTVLSVPRLFARNRDQRPVRVRVTIPEGWEQVDGREGRPPKLRPVGETFMPSITIQAQMDNLEPDEVAERLAATVEEARTSGPGGEPTVVGEADLPNGKLLTRRIQSGRTFEMLCWLPQEGQPYVVLVQGLAQAEDESSPTLFERVCRETELLGPEAE